MFFSRNLLTTETGLQFQKGDDVALDLSSGFFLKTNVFSWKEMDSFPFIITLLISECRKDFMHN